MSVDVDHDWRLSTRKNEIKFEDLSLQCVDIITWNKGYAYG